MSTLALAMCALLEISLPSGATTLVRHIRQLGGTSHCQRVADHGHDASARAGVPEALLDSVLVHESQLNPNAISWNGTSRGLAQLNVRSKYWRMYRHTCRAIPSYCEWASVYVGALALRDALSICHGRWICGVVVYRFGRIMPARERDRKVVRVARLWGAL